MYKTSTIIISSNSNFNLLLCGCQLLSDTQTFVSNYNLMFGSEFKEYTLFDSFDVSITVIYDADCPF